MRPIPALLALALLAAALPAQTPGQTPGRETPTPSGASPAVTATAAAARVAHSARAERAPDIDGRDDDAAWKAAPVIDAFRTFDPVEDGDPRFRTEARVLHDARNLYVFVRAHDPRPDSIVALLSRRDVRTPSDHLKLMIDSFHDRRTGYEFAVNPVGVKRDYYTYDDAREDVSWDAVWDVATRVDSLGWTAEFRIPLSQLRFPERDDHTFGLMIMRDIGRLNERIAWPTYRRSRPGIASQFGDLAGLTGIGAPRRLEVAPYVLTRNVSARTADGFARAQQQSIGGDLKYGVTPNLTLDLSVNPDFGQVEADPAVLNLTAFEVFQSERRPFFLEGTGIFAAGQDPTRLFYSRRIGRAPQLAGLVSDPTARIPGQSTILGAAKLTGRLARGTSLGVLSAVTQEEHVRGTVIEPRTAFGVVRVAQDFRRGETGLGVMLSGMQRADGDRAVAERLRGDALAGGVDLRHRFRNGGYQLNASAQASRVAGTPGAIARTQRGGVHYYQRPDDDLAYDSTRTALTGTAASVALNKVSGTFLFNTLYERITPGFETNDVGFLSRADLQRTYAELLWVSRRPRAFWRNATATLFTSHQWTAGGMPLYHNIDAWTDVQFKNQKGVFVEAWLDQWGGSMCDRCAFGGPALRMSPDQNWFLQLTDDPRKAVSPLVAAILTRGDEGRSQLWRVRPLVRLRAGAQVSGELGMRYERNRDATQWVGNVGSGAAMRSRFAHLDQHTLGVQARLDYTIRPTLSLQLYAEPFVSTGAYSDVREVVAPRAARYADRFRAVDQEVEGFNAKQFRSNAVMRWEYRPGSTLFVVWQQGRDQGDRDPGDFRAWRDYRNLFGARPDNTLLVKASYWFGR